MRERCKMKRERERNKDRRFFTDDVKLFTYQSTCLFSDLPKNFTIQWDSFLYTMVSQFIIDSLERKLWYVSVRNSRCININYE